MMTNNKNSSRRKFLINFSAMTMASQLPIKPLHANTVKLPLNLTSLPLEIINTAKELVNGKNVTLTILQPKGSFGNIKPIGELFQKQTGIAIKYVEASLDEINAKILAQSLSSQSLYDLALPATFGLPDLIESNAIRPLDEYVAKYEPHDLKDGMLHSVGDYYKGKFYGYQTDGDTYLMFYNKSWLESDEENANFRKQFGYDLKIPDTWQQLDQMIKFFNRPTENKFGGALFRNKDYLAWEWWSRFHAKGYFPFDDELKPQINSNGGVEALTELINVSEYLYPQATTNGLFDNWEAFSQGNIFCNIGWGGTQKYLNGPDSKIRNNLLFGPTPGGYIDDKFLKAAYFNWGWNYTVSTKSHEPELAYLFSLYACSPEISTIAVQYREGYFDPFRVEHYDDQKIQETYSNDFLKVHKLSMQDSIPDLYLTGHGEYWDVLIDNLSLASTGKISPKFALDATAKVWTQISKRHGINNQLIQWKYLKSYYPASIKDRLI